MTHSILLKSSTPPALCLKVLHRPLLCKTAWIPSGSFPHLSPWLHNHNLVSSHDKISAEVAFSLLNGKKLCLGGAAGFNGQVHIPAGGKKLHTAWTVRVLDRGRRTYWLGSPLSWLHIQARIRESQVNKLLGWPFETWREQWSILNLVEMPQLHLQTEEGAKGLEKWIF